MCLHLVLTCQVVVVVIQSVHMLRHVRPELVMVNVTRRLLGPKVS